MKRNTYFKFLAVALTICLLITSSSFPTTVVASNVQTVEQMNAEETVLKLPDIIDEAEAEENNYIGRIKEAEPNLSTFVFANGDGTNTMRVYSHPVKYVAENGTVRDISLDVKAKADGGFVTADHEIITTFARNLTDGISLEYNNIKITLTPELAVGTKPVATLSNNGKSVAYDTNNATSFVYELTYTGFKEDIVVEEYTGQTEYEFTLYTNGLTLCEENGSYYLADAEGNVKATIGDIIVFTADERNNTMGSMTHETVRTNQEYRLTIHLDAAYLADEDTVYPIRIDPTVEIYYDQNGAGAIEDVTIKENATYGGTHTSLYVGRHTDGSLSRALMRFPNLSLSGIAPEQITAATVELRDLMCQDDQDMTIDCHIYGRYAPAWSESGTTTWSSVGTAYVGAWLDSKLITYGNGNVSGERHRYAFDILAAVKKWANGSENPQRGLVFKANTTFENQTGDSIKTWYKTFAAYNRSAYRPSLSITYTYLSNVETLELNETETVNVTIYEDRKVFQFTPENDGFYTFESFNITSGDPQGWLYNVDYEELTTNNDGGSGDNFRLTYHLLAGETYYFIAGFSFSGMGHYSVKLTIATDVASIDASILPLGDVKNTSISTAYGIKVYEIVPTVTGEYIFYSSETNGDPWAWLYDSMLNQIGHDNDGGYSYNFTISATLTVGQTYYLVARHVGWGIGQYAITSLLPASVPDDVYCIQNIGTTKYVDIHGPAEQQLVHQWDFHVGTQSKWTIQKQSDGYYTIRSLYGAQKYIGILNTNTNENNIKLYDEISNNTKWRIFCKPDGTLLFVPRNAIGMALYAPDDFSGTELRLVDIGTSVNDRDKWRFAVQSSTTLEGQHWEWWCWAAAARMFVNHYYDVPDERDQSYAVTMVKGSVVNDGGYLNDAIVATSFYRSGDTANLLEVLGGYGERLPEEDVKSLLNEGHVIYISRYQCNINNEPQSGHATVIVGYITLFIDGALQYRYIIYDSAPEILRSDWPEPIATIQGQKYYRSYEWICNGRNDVSLDDGDKGIWTNYFAVATIHSNNGVEPVWN